MAGLQRSEISFRRQGSSGLVWDDRLISGELNPNPVKKEEEQQGQELQAETQEKLDSKETKPSPINTVPGSRSNGGERRGYRTGKVSPAVEPPSPKLSVCGFCSAFGKSPKNHRKKAGKHGSR